MERPPFCPNPTCAYHRPRARKPPRWYRSAGTYHTAAFGTVARFRCTRCGAYFSTQTFSLDYYAKRTLSYPRLFTHLITTSSKYFPCHINLLAGADSQTVYWFDYVTLRRKGRMSGQQRKRREKLEKRFRADPKGLQRSFSGLFEHTAHLICDASSASSTCASPRSCRATGATRCLPSTTSTGSCATGCSRGEPLSRKYGRRARSAAHGSGAA